MSRHKSKPKWDHGLVGPKEEGQQKEMDYGHIHVDGGVEVDFVQELRKKHDSERSEDAADRKKQLFWTRATAVLVFISSVRL